MSTSTHRLGPDPRNPLMHALMARTAQLALGITLALIATTASAKWHAVTQPGDFDGPVYDLCVFRGELIATGFFATGGGVRANNIAAFDGQSWRPLLGGIGAPSREDGTSWGEVLAEYRDELWVGGRFLEVDGAPGAYLARWDGNQWHTMNEDPVQSRVSALEVVGDALYVGGQFRRIGSLVVNHVARYRDRWRPLERGTSGGVLGIGHFDNRVFVGGLFSTASAQAAPAVAYWADQNWFGFAPSLSSADRSPAAVFDFHEHEGELYATGHFHNSGLQKTPGVARLEANRWVGVDDGLGLFGGTLIGNEFATYDGELVIVGRMETAGGDEVNNIARLVDGVWQSMGGGTDSEVKCAEVFQGSLYIGGFFGQAGNVSSPIVARWENQKAALPRITNLSLRSSNPTAGSVEFFLELPSAETVGWSVYDARGIRVASAASERLEAGSHPLRWDGRSSDGSRLPRGVYYMAVEIGGETSVRKLTLIRER